MKKIILIPILVFFCFSISGKNTPPRIINIVNFIRQTDYRLQKADSLLFDAVAKQIMLVKQYGFPATFLIQYDALINAEYQHLLKSQLPKNCELGAWWEITQPQVEAAGLKWRGVHSWVSTANIAFTTGYTQQEREKLADVYMDKFKEIYGKYPASVGSWFIDAHTLNYLYEKYGIVASCNCKDQVGTDGYTLWGGYWNQAYYPSRTNAYMPAQTEEGQIPVPIFRMLGSDPIYQYETGVGTDRQGVISLEPVYTDAGKNRKWVDYFLESIVEQPCLSFGYAQAGQENSFTWDAMREGLEMQFSVFDSLSTKGKVRLETLNQSGQWFKKQFKVTPATAVTALKDPREEGNKTLWYNSRYYRANLFWEKNNFSFRDIHLFDESIESDYYDKAGIGGQFFYFTLPFIDRFFWSTPDDKIGLRIISIKKDGSRNDIVLTKPVVTEKSGSILKVSTTDKDGNLFLITFFEDKIEVFGKMKRKGDSWLMELKVPQSRIDRLPFYSYEKSNLHANFKDHHYQINCEKGSVKRGNDIDFVFQLVPENNYLTIDCKSKPIANITGLQIDHLENPLGIDNATPRLSWKIMDKRKGAAQTAYQLVVNTDSLAVANGVGEMWNTGKIVSDKMLVVYAGKSLQPFTRYYWKVIAWDMDSKENSSLIQSFETGMMDKENWNGKWIDDGKDKEEELAPYFRKAFKIERKVKFARASIAVAGLYELYINGEKIGNHRLDPMYTRFDRRNLYVTFDITSQLQQGENAIGVLLGNGWYNHQSKAVWNFDRAPWRARPTFCADIRITYEDGSVQIISSDTTWKTASGELIFNSIYTAEHVDFNLEMKGWNTTDFDDKSWSNASLRIAPSGNIVAQQLQPIRNVKALEAQSITRFNDTTYVFDFGQNIAGVTHFKIKGEKGTVVKLKHGERLYDNGRVDMSNIDVYYRGDKEKEPFQADILILNGEENEFIPKFNYKGFRYVEVTISQPMNIGKRHLKAYFMHSDVAPIGNIEASDPLINRLQQAANNSYLSNLMGYPTDCPQREKNGWTGDGHLAIEAALYNFDAITVYEKWLADFRDEQRSDGVLPDIIPTGGWGYGTANGLDWTSAVAIIPWNIYLFYGDSKLLEDCYENIKRYVNYVDKNYPDGLTTFGRGDWVPVRSQSNLELTSSVYYYVDAVILAQAAKLFNNSEDEVHYVALAEKIKNAVNQKYLNRATGLYASGTQTELSVPLYWKIVPKELIAKVAQNLALKVEETGFHLDVGVLGAKAILNALSENGYADTAYKLAVQKTYPSWGWWIENGATTLLENWDLNATRDISDNHMMFGEIGAWFYKGVGGIFPDPQQPGFKHIILRPNFVADLSDFKAQHNSSYGWIKSEWTRSKSKVQYKVVIPQNTKATLYLPSSIEGEKVINLTAGKYEFDFNTFNH